MQTSLINILLQFAFLPHFPSIISNWYERIEPRSEITGRILDLKCCQGNQLIGEGLFVQKTLCYYNLSTQ